MVHHSAALAREGAREGGDAALTEAVVSADLDAVPEPLRSLCAYALKLTLPPVGDAARGRGCAARGRSLGSRDRRCHQVVSYFNYVNRIADGLGVPRRWACA